MFSTSLNSATRTVDKAPEARQNIINRIMPPLLAKGVRVSCGDLCILVQKHRPSR